VSGASHATQVAPASGDPQLAQNFPVPVVWQTEQVIVGAGASCGEAMRGNYTPVMAGAPAVSDQRA
jgi:hypothetical protein